MTCFNGSEERRDPTLTQRSRKPFRVPLLRTGFRYLVTSEEKVRQGV